VLHVGDSFVHAFLWQTLRPQFLAEHTQYVVQAATATYTTTWASSPTLDEWLSRRPSLVLVTLGANEVEMPIPEQHARAIETIAKKIASAGAACVWITPPMWKEETGILEIIHDHCAPCLFLDSDAVTGGLSPDERQPDHIHPNYRGGRRWGRAVWDWITEHRDTARGPWALDPFERRGQI
jgi:lysophospholipase L1-like esterase